MPPQGTCILSEFADQKIHVQCLRCEIRRRYDGSAMIARVGGDVVMPDLLNLIARGKGCTLNHAPTPKGLTCSKTFTWLTLNFARQAPRRGTLIARCF